MRVTYLPEPDEFLVEDAGREVAYPRREFEGMLRILDIALKESDPAWHG